MKDRVAKLRNDIETNPHNQSDELVIVGLRLIELGESLEKLFETKGVTVGRTKRKYTRRRKSGPKPD